jgi:hypothetical protein
MTFPLTSLLVEHRELGLIVAVLLGVGFGFTLERAGFGRANKLAAQFYLTDMTVLKVMFTAIVVAMLGLLVAGGLGIADVKAISESAASHTYLWPMIVGGLLLGAGFIISGYCPGTSVVATASGNIDGAFAIGGVVLGSLLYSELHAALPGLAAFNDSSHLGHLFLYQWLGIPAPVLGLGVTLMALGAFFGAEKVEALMAKRRGEEAESQAPEARRPRRFAFAGLAGVALLALATLAMPLEPRAAVVKPVHTLTQRALAKRLLERSWSVRVLDLRDAARCRNKTLPGAECAPVATLEKLGLAHASGARDLVLVGAGELKTAPKAATRYRGRVYLLAGGFAGWHAYALTPPPAPAASASAAALREHRFRAALNAAVTGRKAAPPPKASKRYVPRARKKKGGGCG